MSRADIRDPYRLRPADQCPKCGDQYGFSETSGVDPRYIPPTSFSVGQQGPGFLGWECRNCGYLIQTKTADNR